MPLSKLRDRVQASFSTRRRATVTLMRVALGGLLINASLFVILHYIDLLIPNPANGDFTSSLVDAKILYLAKIVEFSVGILLVCNIFVPLALVMILPISIIVAWVDYLLDPQPSSIVACTVIVGLNVALLFLHLPYYRGMLVRRTDGGPSRVWRTNETFAVVLGIAGAAFFATTVALDPDFTKPTPATGMPIRIGRTADLSGQGALFASIQAKFFEDLSARGGIEGRPVKLVILDDRGDQGQAALNVKRLAAMKDVAALLDSETDMTAQAVRRAASAARIPSLFSDVQVPYGAEGEEAGWSMGFLPDQHAEAQLLLALAAREARGTPVTLFVPKGWSGGMDAETLGVTFQLGHVMVRPVNGAAADDIASFLRSPKHKGVGAIVLALDPACTARALVAIRQGGWRRPVLLSSQAALTLSAEQLGASWARLLSIRYYKDGYDPLWSKLRPLEFKMWPKWDSDRSVQAYTVFLRDHIPNMDAKDRVAEAAYTHAEAMAAVLRRSIEQPSREMILRQARRLQDANMSLLTPGVVAYVGAGRRGPISQAQPILWRARSWTETGKIVDAEISF